MLLEDLFDVHDVMRLILKPDSYVDVLTSIRLRLVSRRMQQIIIAAGYTPGCAIVEHIDTCKGCKYSRYRSWSQAGPSITAAFIINLVDPIFTDPKYWTDIVATTHPFTYTAPWKYKVTACFTHIKGHELFIANQYAGRLMNAIFGALDNARAWFLEVLLTFGRPTVEPIHGAEYLLLEYALRYDDPSLVAKHVGHFSLRDFEELLTGAIALDRPNVIAWFMETPNVVNTNAKDLQLHILEKHIVHARAMTEPMDPFQAVARWHQATRKRKADAELVRVATELKQARIEDAK